MSFMKPIALALAGAFLTGSAMAQTVELKFGHVGEPGSLFDLSAQEFAKRVEQNTGGKVKVAVFGSSQLGEDKDMLKKIKLGTIDLCLPSTVMSSEVPEFGLFEMPYLVRDRDHMKAIEQQVVWPTLAPAAEKKGYKILAVWENGFRQITNNAHPINKPEDLKGIKLRVPKGTWRVKMFEAYGASPSPMAFSEVFVALQTGVMDGQENPYAQIYPAKLHEVQKFLSITDHVYTPAYVVANPDKMAKLPEDVRQAIEKAAKETQAYVYETAARLDNELLDKLKQAGMQVNTADKKAFVAASKEIYDDFGKEVPGGAELVAKAMQAGPATAKSN